MVRGDTSWMELSMIMAAGFQFRIKCELLVMETIMQCVMMVRCEALACWDFENCRHIPSKPRTPNLASSTPSSQQPAICGGHLYK